ncbi:MAG: AraC family transcriptional regulator [Eubacteriales bacterium]|nr:AraC family transcriptional regulator [Eubacteriales bacterium]
MAYESIQIDAELHIESIYTIHYFEYQKDFYFAGERHDFWEFQCVDKGMARVRTDNGVHVLNKGQAIFHRPGEFHDLTAVGQTAPNIVVISFGCHSPSMDFFNRRIVDISDTERSLMGMIIGEARRCIASPLDDPYLQKMEKRPDPPFGSQQLIRLYLEQMLIYIIRRNGKSQLSVPDSQFSDLKTGSAAYNKILCYLEEHIQVSLTIEDICHDNLIGRSQLQKLFREQNGCGVIEQFSLMKIDLAKRLIRENQMNFTQISDFLGYSSIHYFSRQFKKISGMTPTEYATSIKARSERGQTS